MPFKGLPAVTPQITIAGAVRSRPSADTALEALRDIANREVARLGDILPMFFIRAWHLNVSHRRIHGHACQRNRLLLELHAELSAAMAVKRSTRRCRRNPPPSRIDDIEGTSL